MIVRWLPNDPFLDKEERITGSDEGRRKQRSVLLSTDGDNQRIE